MTTKDWLSQGKTLQIQCAAKLDQIHELETMAAKITSSIGTDSIRGKGGVNRKIESFAVKIADEQAQLWQDVEDLMQIRAKIKHVISAVEKPEYRAVLTERYLTTKSWDEIGDTLGYGVRQIQNIHGNALRMVQIPPEWNGD